MRIGEVIGTVTLNRAHPALAGGTFRLAVPLKLEGRQWTADHETGALVVYDELSAGLGSQIAIAEGPEAGQPFRPKLIPLDAYNAAILDDINLH